MTHEERALTILYLEGMKDNYIEGEGYERHPLPEYYAIEEAIKALEGKDIDVPTNSALDHIHNVVAEREYQRGYEQGKADAEKEMHDNILRYRMPEPWEGEQHGQE